MEAEAVPNNNNQLRKTGQVTMILPIHVPLLSCCAWMLLQASTAAKLAFLMPPRHHNHYQTSFSTLHHRRSTDIIYSLPRLCNSRLKATSGSDDDGSICDVYQQVKEEDSEWYSKISQMLGNDEMELLDTSTFTCGDDNKEVELQTKANGKVNQVGETSKQIANSLASDDQTSKEDASVVVSKKASIKETPKLETPTDSLIEDSVDEAPSIQEESAEAPVAARHSEGHYTQNLDDDDEEDEEDFTEEISNKGTKSKVQSSNTETSKNDDVQRQQNQVDDEKVEPNQATPSPIVRIYNEFTKEHENIAPFSTLEKLGYNEKELELLRPQVLELIVDDRIPRPRRGIPKRWVKSVKDDQYDEEEERFDDDFGWQVQVVSRKKPTKKRESSSESQNNEQRVIASKDDTADAVEDRIENQKDVAPVTRRSIESREDEPSSRIKDESSRAPSGKVVENELNEIDDELKQPRRQQQQQQQQQEQQYSSDYEQDFRRERGYRPPPQRRRRPESRRDDGYDEPQNRRPRGQRGSDRRQRTPKRQELLIDRESYGDDPSGNKFWMDLPMFKDFLRKEAQFRLKILGPDWKESVLDESRWRYDLYKAWLQMVDEGVGENPLYTYTDMPRSRRRRSRSQSDANYEREIDTRAASGRRAPRSQQDVKQRRTVDDDDDYNYEERRSKRKLDDVDVDQRRRTRIPEQTRNEQRPKRQSRSSQPPRKERWTNFSDLEDSLLRSKSREDYSQRSSGSYADEIPRRRRRSSDDYEEESDEDETPRRRYSTDAYVDALEEDQRRRSRARRNTSYEQFDDDDEL
jgi:hypothetical protein